MEHTPGPWKATQEREFYKRGVVQPWCIRTDIKETLIDKNTWIVRMFDKFDKEAEANANLIAAAPDLLEACKFMMDLMDRLTTDDFQKGKDKPARDMMGAAISRATKE